MLKMNNKIKKINRKKEKFPYIYLAGIFIFLLIIFFSFYFEGQDKEENNFFNEDFFHSFDDEEIKDSLSLDNFLEIKIDMLENDIFMINKKNKCEAIVVSIEASQAFSIQQALLSEIFFRPTGHDLTKEILENYNINFLFIKITEIKNGAYIGRMILEKENKILDIDVRPSDGIAVALRTESPIYINKNLFQENKMKIC